MGRLGRTTASAVKSQKIDLYVALPEGVYIYKAVHHCLMSVVGGDFRRRSGRLDVATAPVNIFYVVDIVKYEKTPFQEPGLKNQDVQKSYYYCVPETIINKKGRKCDLHLWPVRFRS